MGSNSKHIQWWEPQVGQEEKQILLDVLNSNFLNDGEWQNCTGIHYTTPQRKTVLEKFQ